MGMKLIIIVVALAAAGCQNSGLVLESRSSSFCTECKMETKSTFIKGVTVSSFMCPKCETEIEYDDGGEETFHICANCGRALEKCPICKMQEW